jgi:hypothetical protein
MKGTRRVPTTMSTAAIPTRSESGTAIAGVAREASHISDAPVTQTASGGILGSRLDIGLLL